MDTNTNINKGFPFKIYLNCPDTGSILNYLNCYMEENIDSFFDKIYEFEKKQYIEKNNKNTIDENDNIKIYKNISFKLDTVHDFTESRKDENILTTQEIFTYLDWKDIYPYKKNNFESDFFFWLLRRKEFINMSISNETHYNDFEMYVTSTIENYCNLTVNSKENTELNIVIDASDTKVNNFKNLILFQNFYDQAIKKYNDTDIKKIQCRNRKTNPSNSLELREVTTNELIDTMIENNKLNCKIIYPQLFDANATTGKTIKWRNYNIGKLDITNEIDEIEFNILNNDCRIVFVKDTKTVYFQIKDKNFYFNTIKIQQSQQQYEQDIKNPIIKKLELEFNSNERELNDKDFKIKEVIKFQGKNYIKTKSKSLLFYNTGPGISELLKYYDSYKQILLKELNEISEILRFIYNEMKRINEIDDNIVFIKKLGEYFIQKNIGKIIKDKNTKSYIINIIINIHKFLLEKKYNKHIKSLIYIFEKTMNIDITRRITIETLNKYAEEYYENKYKKLAENIFLIKRAGDYSQIFYCKIKKTKNKEYIFSSIDRMSASFCLLEKVNFIGTLKEYGIFLKFSKNILMDNLKEPSMKCNKLYHYKSYLDSPNISKYIKFLSINFNLNYMKCYDALFFYEIIKFYLSGKDVKNLTSEDIKTLYKNMAFKIDTVHDFKRDRTNGIFNKEDEDKIYSVLWEKINYKNISYGYEPGSILDRKFLKNIITKINKIDYDNIQDENYKENGENEDDDDDENKEDDEDNEDILNLQNYEIEEVNENTTENKDMKFTIKEDKKLGIFEKKENIGEKRKRYTELSSSSKKTQNIKNDIEKLKEENKRKIENKEDIINKIPYTKIDIGTALTFILENLEENFFYWLIHRQYYPMDINGKIYKLENSLNVVFSSSIENFSECISKDTNTLCIDASSKIISNFKNMLIVNNILKIYPNIYTLENKINDFKNSINNDIYFITKKQSEDVYNYIKKNLSNIISDIVKINMNKQIELNYEDTLNIYYNLSLIFRLCIINEISTENLNIIFYILNGPNNPFRKNLDEILISKFDISKDESARDYFLHTIKNLNYKSLFNINDEAMLYLLLEENIINMTPEKSNFMKLIVIFKNITSHENILVDILDGKIENEISSNFEEILKMYKMKKKKNRQNKDTNDFIIENINYIYKQLENEYKLDYEDIYKDEILSRIQYQTIANDTGAKFKIIPPQIFDANTSTGKHISIRNKNLEEAMDSAEKFCLIDRYKKNLDLYKQNNIDIIKLADTFDNILKKLLVLLQNMKKYINNAYYGKYIDNTDLVYIINSFIIEYPDKREEGIKLIKNYMIFMDNLYNFIILYNINKEILYKTNDRLSSFMIFIKENVDKIKEYMKYIEQIIEHPKDKDILYNFNTISELLGYGKISRMLLYSEILKNELKLYKDAELSQKFNECDINIVSSNIKSSFTETNSLYEYKIEGENEKMKVISNIYEIKINTNLNYPIKNVKVFNINKEEIKEITEINITNEIASIIIKDLDINYENNVFYNFLKQNMNKNIFTQYIEIKGKKRTKINIKEKYIIHNNFTNKNTYYCYQNKTLYCYDTGPGVADLSMFYKKCLETYPYLNEKDILQNIFDIKRYGDYSQIAYCKSNKYIYVSNDRMSASFSFIEGSEFIGPFKSCGLFLKNIENECAGTKDKIENDNYENVVCIN